MYRKHTERPVERERSTARAAHETPAEQRSPDHPRSMPSPEPSPPRNEPATHDGELSRPERRIFLRCDVSPDPHPLDQLEEEAASSEPKATAAWWVALQTARHVIETATDRDLHTGDSLPQPLSKVLSNIDQKTRSGVRPIPADHLHRTTCLTFDAVRSVLAQPRTRLLREHEQRPIYDLREMDAQCMAWLARQPGRSIREKLAGKQHALSVVRRFTLDTPENRVMCRVLELLHRRLNLRFDAAATYDPEGPCNAPQRKMFDLCRHALRATEFASVPPSEVPRPNNVLLNDRHYSRIWRAWMLLDQEEQALESAWSNVKEDFTTALFWILAGHVATTHGARVPEALMVPATEIEGRMTIADRSGSGAEVRTLALLVTSQEPTDDGTLVGWIEVLVDRHGIQGYVKFINRDKKFGFVVSEAGDEYYFNPRTLRSATVFDELEEKDRIVFQLPSQNPVQGRNPPVVSIQVIPDAYSNSVPDGNSWGIVRTADEQRLVFTATDLDDEREFPALRRDERVALLFEGQRIKQIRPISPPRSHVVHLRRTDTGLSTAVSTLSAERGLSSWSLGRVKSVKKHGERSSGSLRSAAKAQHGRHPRATDLHHPIRPLGLRAASIEIEDQVSWRIEFGDGLDLASGRGVPVFAVRDDPEPQGRVHFNALADLGGLRDLSCTLNPLSTRTPEKRTEMAGEDGPGSSEVADVGIDAFGWRIFVHGAGPIRPRTLPYALRRESTASSAEAGWQVGTSLRLPQVAQGTTIESLTATVDAGDSGDEQSGTTGCRHIFRALADELEQLQASRADTAAFAVPDGLDDFSLQALRAAMRSGFPRSWPVARSVTAALSWQQHAGFLDAQVRDGDNILVLSADVIGLTFTLLVARWNRGLMDAHPQTGGIFWERRPDIPCDEYGDGLGIRGLWLDYTRRLVDAMDDNVAAPGDEAYREFLVSYLIDTGLPQGTVPSGTADWIFDTWASDAERWLVLEHAPTIWREAVHRWRRRFDVAMRDGLAKIVAAALPRAARCHLLLVGSPMDEPRVRSHIEQTVRSMITRVDSATTRYIAPERGDLAAGAKAFLERFQEGHPVWRDWLPDLYLEVVRNGFYDELEIMRATDIDARMGEVRDVEVEATLTLPASHTHYTLPLVAGRANHRPSQVDFRLDSSEFPLNADTPVRLQLHYRYGVENGYELTVVPEIPSSAPFQRITGTWNRGDRASERKGAGPVPSWKLAPAVPSEDKWNDIKIKANKSLDDVSRKLAILLSGSDGNPQESAKNLSKELSWLRYSILSSVNFVRQHNLETEPPVPDSKLREKLIMIAGYEGGREFPSAISEETFRRLQEQARVFLCVLGNRVPDPIRTWVREHLSSGDRIVDAPSTVADAVGTLQRADPSRFWMDALWKKVVLGIHPSENPRLYGRSILAIAETAWEASDFIEAFAERNHSPSFIDTVLRVSQKGVQNIASKAAQACNSDTGLSGGHARTFQAWCELILALLRLRGSPLGGSLTAGSPPMIRLAKTIRRADCLLTRAGMEVRTSLNPETSKPEALGRVTDLAFTVNYYLVGSEDLNLIHG